MPPFDFPANPPPGTLVPGGNGAQYLWDSTKWIPAMQPVPPLVGGPFLPIPGGAMTGPLLLAADPTEALGAATRQYVDGAVTRAGGPFLPVSYVATGSITSRSAQDRAADVVHVKDFGAVFDGASHPLSAYYATLAAAQAVYPKATALTNEIDGIAIQAALDFCAARSGVANDYSYGGTVILPNAKGLLNTPLTINASCVALRSHGHGITMREPVAAYVQSAACHLLWTGPAVASGGSCIYMLTVAVTDGGRRLNGCNVEGILFDCNGVVGISGVLIASVYRSKFYIGVDEARGVTYPGSVLTAASQNITVSSSANIRIGQSITSANSLEGAYVSAIINGTTIEASSQALASATETVLIGGECIRMDCVSSITDVNDCQYCDCWFVCNQETGAQYSYGPCVVLGGTSNPGSAGGFTHYGNTSMCTFHMISVNNFYGVGLVVANTDHNMFHHTSVANLTGPSKGVILNGWLSTINGGARYNVFDYVVGLSGVWSIGTNSGGFTQAARGNTIRNLDMQNVAAGISSIGTGSSIAVSNCATPTLLIPCNTAVPVVAQLTDSTVSGGNVRGPYATDLQTSRIAATQVASGNWSVLPGGQNNTASGDFSVVTGGYGNNASGSYGSITGGQVNVASQTFSVASGSAASADLFAVRAHASGLISSGRRAQHNIQVLRVNTGANTTPVRLTADAAAAGSLNVVNIASVSGHQCSALSVALSATDSTNSANCFVWRQPLGLLKRSGIFSSTVYTPLGTPVSGGTGTVAGIAVTEAADTTNGGYNLTFTPPTGNAVVWRVAATVEWTRVDGA